MFSDLYIDIYILPYHHLLGVCLCGVLLFGELRRRFDLRWWWKPCLSMVLLGWAAVVLWATVFSRGGGLEAEWLTLPFHSYREVLAGGNPEILRSNLMNVVLFVPAGLLSAALLPEKWPMKWQILLITFLFCLFSTGIEWNQYFRALGCAEMDDILHNTLGAVAGFAAFHLRFGSHASRRRCDP